MSEAAMNEQEIRFFYFLIGDLSKDLPGLMSRLEKEAAMQGMQSCSLCCMVGNSLRHLPLPEKAAMASLWHEHHGPGQAGLADIMTAYTALIVDQIRIRAVLLPLRDCVAPKGGEYEIYSDD